MKEDLDTWLLTFPFKQASGESPTKRDNVNMPNNAFWSNPLAVDIKSLA